MFRCLASIFVDPVSPGYAYRRYTSIFASLRHFVRHYTLRFFCCERAHVFITTITGTCDLDEDARPVAFKFKFRTRSSEKYGSSLRIESPDLRRWAFVAFIQRKHQVPYFECQAYDSLALQMDTSDPTYDGVLHTTVTYPKNLVGQDGFPRVLRTLLEQLRQALRHTA